MASWRNGSVSVLHTDGGGSIPPEATKIMNMEKYIFLGEVENKWLLLIDKLAKTKDIITILEKLELGDSNQIKIAKLLR